jgi:glycosyltransferase involved in cell wall biosynthesis
MALPKVSIVTPSFNQGRYLPETLRSVREQNYPHIEHLIVDGGSTDETLSILKSASDIRWISEPDRGQVDALNKGFGMVTGEILAWLNADDLFLPNTVSEAVAALQRTPADLVYGDVEIINEQGQCLRQFRGIPFDFSILLYGINYIGQQSTFFRRSLLDKAGPLREEFNNSFDYELWLRMSRYGKVHYEPRVRGKIRLHDAAKSVAQADVTARNDAAIRRQYWSYGPWPVLFSRHPLFLIPNLYYRAKRQWILRGR